MFLCNKNSFSRWNGGIWLSTVIEMIVICELFRYVIVCMSPCVKKGIISFCFAFEIKVCHVFTYRENSSRDLKLKGTLCKVGKNF